MRGVGGRALWRVGDVGWPAGLPAADRLGDADGAAYHAKSGKEELSALPFFFTRISREGPRGLTPNHLSGLSDEGE